MCLWMCQHHQTVFVLHLYEWMYLYILCQIGYYCTTETLMPCGCHLLVESNTFKVNYLLQHLFDFTFSEIILSIFYILRFTITYITPARTATFQVCLCMTVYVHSTMWEMPERIRLPLLLFAGWRHVWTCFPSVFRCVFPNR